MSGGGTPAGMEVVNDLPNVILPGTEIARTVRAPTGEKKRIARLGLGVVQRGRSILATKAGQVKIDERTGRITVDSNQRRYVAGVGNMVIGIVIEKHSEEYRVALHGTDTAVLSVLGFEGATKRNKPSLNIGSAVYALVTRAVRSAEVEITCIEPGSAKSWVGKQTTYGELEGGTLVRVSLALARALQVSGNFIFKTIGPRIPFECAIGLNGLVWVKSNAIQRTVLVAQAVEKADVLNREEWTVWVKKLLRAST